MVPGISMVFPIRMVRIRLDMDMGQGMDPVSVKTVRTMGCVLLMEPECIIMQGLDLVMVDDQIPTDMGMASGSDLLFFKFPVNIGRSDFFVSSKVSRPQTRAHLRPLLKYR